MQTIEQPDLNDTIFEEQKISGFDASGKSIFREPTLYLSIFALLITSLLALSNTPTLFWMVFISLSAITVVFHILAERYIFSTRKEFKQFAMPYEGLFVVTFGSLLPGICLLGYSIYSMFYTHPANYFIEVGKIILLLIVPVLNLTVWQALRKRYLGRPRLVGMMNGVSLGFSLSWTIIWLKTCFFSAAVASCKFGWMLLLCVSPFLLLASILMEKDLLFKTEARISRITGAFSVLGVLLSFLFVFTPTIHSLVVQSALQDARTAEPADLSKRISYVQSIATSEDLRPSEYPVNGFSLGGMLIPQRGLESGSQIDKDLFFRITGAPCHEVGQHPYDPSTWIPEESDNQNVAIGAKIPNLHLAKSQITGRIDARSLTAVIDWLFTFHNGTTAIGEPRAELELPAGAIVTGATLWLNNRPQEGIEVPLNIQNPTYRTPVLVTKSGDRRVLINCPNVPSNGGRRALRIRFIMPLLSSEKACSVKLPKIIESNFAQPKRTHVRIASNNELVRTDTNVISKVKGSYILEATIRNEDSEKPADYYVEAKRPESLKDIAIKDVRSGAAQFIVQRLEKTPNHRPKQLFVVIDASESMKPYLQQLQQAIMEIPKSYHPKIFFAKTPADKEAVSAYTLIQAQSMLAQNYFVGGQDNSFALKEVLESAAEKTNSAVLWVHGPQPIGNDLQNPVDLDHKIKLYDFEIQAGPNVLTKSPAIISAQNAGECEYIRTKRASTVANDVASLISDWNKQTAGTRICRVTVKNTDGYEMITDSLSAAAVSSLWSNEEVTRLIEDGQMKKAELIAANYHMVSRVSDIALNLSGAQILDPSLIHQAPKQCITYVGNTAIATKAPAETITVGGQSIGTMGNGQANLVGTLVEPRYGQSNEVGQLADYGYDTARDIARFLTALSIIFTIPIFLSLMRRRKDNSASRLSFAKGVALALSIPLAVHLMGTFLINNFGGLGGGL